MALFEQVVEISKPYLGVAAPQFVSRQCTVHLKVDPKSLTSTHLPELGRWVEISAGLLIDKGKAAELKQKVLSIR